LTSWILALLKKSSKRPSLRKQRNDEEEPNLIFSDVSLLFDICGYAELLLSFCRKPNLFNKEQEI